MLLVQLVEAGLVFLVATVPTGEPVPDAARSAALAQDREGARTPALTNTASVAPLTAREREICFLAAGGLTSKEIVDRAYLRVRTVNNHLQNAHVKLGIGGRRELAEALRLAA